MSNKKVDLYEDRYFKYLLPKYSKLTVFLFSISIILLFSINQIFREELINFILEDFDPRILIFLGVCGAGMFFSFVGIFEKEKFGPLEKWSILFFSIMINASAGFAAGIYILENNNLGFLVIFPILNILNAMLLLFFLRAKIITEKSIIDKDFNKKQIGIGLFSLLIIFAISEFVFNNYWAITFSICSFYTSNILDIVDDYLE